MRMSNLKIVVEDSVFLLAFVNSCVAMMQLSPKREETVRVLWCDWPRVGRKAACLQKSGMIEKRGAQVNDVAEEAAVHLYARLACAHTQIQQTVFGVDFWFSCLCWKSVLCQRFARRTPRWPCCVPSDLLASSGMVWWNHGSHYDKLEWGKLWEGAGVHCWGGFLPQEDLDSWR